MNSLEMKSTPTVGSNIEDLVDIRDSPGIDWIVTIFEVRALSGFLGDDTTLVYDLQRA